MLKNAPLTIASFATSPDVAVRLTMIVSPAQSCSTQKTVKNCQNGSAGILYAAITGANLSKKAASGGTILITSNRPAFTTDLLFTASTNTAVYVGGINVSAPSSRLRRYLPGTDVLTVSISRVEHAQNSSQFGAPIAGFILPSVSQKINGSFFAHLPRIGWSPLVTQVTSESSSTCITSVTAGSSSHVANRSSSGCPGSSAAAATSETIPVTSDNSFFKEFPLIMTESGRVHSRNVDVTVFAPWLQKSFRLSHSPHISRGQGLKLLRSISSYRTIPGTKDELYWETRTQVTEALAGAQSNLADARIDSILSPDGQFQGDSYVWTGTGSLEPSISATNINAAEIQGNYNFLSGIAFATAAAAAIALLQELPHAIPLPRRWPRLRRQPGAQHPAGRAPSGLGWPG